MSFKGVGDFARSGLEGALGGETSKEIRSPPDLGMWNVKCWGGGALRRFLLRKELMFQEHIKDTETVRDPKQDSSRYCERDWEGGFV